MSNPWDEEDEENEEETLICQTCNGSGESPWGPVGADVCWECHGSGINQEEDEEDYQDLVDANTEWERNYRD